MTRLRSGEFTNDPRLDRVKHVDLRTLNYIARPETLGIPREPRSFTWRLEVNLDQGQEGACVGFGWSHELAARPGVVEGVDNQFAREHVYWEAQKVDPYDGGAYPGAAPFSEGSSVLAGAQIAQSLGLIRRYYWATNIGQLILALGLHGPAVFGVDWWTGMFQPDDDGFIRPTGQIEGGHCICAVGIKVVRNTDGSIDYVRSYVLLHNSWGPDWGIEDHGVGGRAKLALVDLAVLWPGGDFCVPEGRVKAVVHD